MLKNVKLASDRAFAIFVIIIALLYVVWSWVYGNYDFDNVAFQYYGLSFLVIIALIAPSFLRPLNYAWMALGQILGSIVSPIVLAIIFFIIFTPVAVVQRALGRDELNLKARSRSSLWRRRVGDDRYTNFDDQF